MNTRVAKLLMADIYIYTYMYIYIIYEYIDCEPTDS